MKEYELEVLERYDVEVKSTRRIRGAFFCDTNEGTMLLKETRISQKRAPLLYLVLSRLENEGHMNVDTPVFTREGELLTPGRDGTCYIMKKWYNGRECDIKRENEVLEAARALAVLHIKMQNLEENGGLPESGIPVRRDPVDELGRHNRELKKIRTFIRSRVGKNEFEYLFLESFEKMYGLAEEVLVRMEGSGCARLFGKSADACTLTHGDYNYHNILMCRDGTAVTNFEHMCVGLRAHDLYYFLRKAMEKHHWKQKLGSEILDAYESVRPLEKTEREYIGLYLAYPEKFWKTASAYYHSNKAWLPEKNVEKLRLAVRQTEEKSEFLESVFSQEIRA